MNEVLKQANIINYKSNGYFDITADPLIELWGFGYKNKKTHSIPSSKEINDALSLVNQKELFELNSVNNEFYKKNKNLKLNLSSIAKGYGIDQIGNKLEKLGIRNYLINIGGDLLAKGNNKNKKDWIIGIENPNLKEKLVKEIIKVSDKGIASSGDYKNFFIKNGIYHNLNETISSCNDSIWKMYRILLRILFLHCLFFSRSFSQKIFPKA